MKLELDQEEALDQGVRELRELQVNPAIVAKDSSAFFAAMDRQTRAARTLRGRSWWHLPVGMVAAAAAAALLSFRLHGNQSLSAGQGEGALEEVALIHQTTPESELVELGGRVALVALPRSNYAIETVSGSQTSLRVRTGALTVRLFHDTDAAHELVVSAGEYSFAAKGTLYTVKHDEGSPRLAVHEGEVWVRDGEGELVDALSAGESWPTRGLAIAGADTAAERLRRHALMPRQAPEEQTRRRSAPSLRKDSPPSPSSVTPPESTAQKWQRARLLRGQSKPEEALAVLKELVASQDPTWAPLAVIEQIRIYRERPAGLENRPDTIIRLGREFSENWGDHPLTDEVASMVCPLLSGQSQPPMAICQVEK